MIGSEKHSFSPQPSGEQENETLKKKETPEHAEECFDWNEEITRLREDFKQQHESRHLENTEKINQFNQFFTEYENLWDYLYFKKAPSSKEASNEISQEHIKDLEQRISLSSKGSLDDPRFFHEISQITAEAGQIATQYFEAEQKIQKLGNRNDQLDARIEELKKAHEEIANLSWLKKTIFYRKRNQLNAEIYALETERNQVKEAKQEQNALIQKIRDNTEDLRRALNPTPLKKYIDNIGERIESDYAEMSHKLASPELIRSQILDELILPNMHKTEETFSQPLRPEQRQAYLQCITDQMDMEFATITNLRSNLQKQESLTDLPPALLDSLSWLPEQVGAWNRYQDNFDFLVSMAIKKEKDEIKNKLKHPQFDHPMLKKLFDPEYNPENFLIKGFYKWPFIRKFAEKTGMVPLSILEDREKEVLKSAERILTSGDTEYSLVETRIFDLIEIGDPAGISILLSHINKKRGHLTNQPLRAITDLFQRAEPEKLSAVLTQMSPDDQELVRIIVDPHSGINSFSNKFYSENYRIVFIQERGPALITHEKNLSVLASLGESEENLSEFFFFTSPLEALSQLKKVSEATKQPYTEILKEALPLLDLYIIEKAPPYKLVSKESLDKASSEILPLAEQWAKELNIPYSELLRQIPKYLTSYYEKYSDIKYNLILNDLIKPGNPELGAFLPGFAQDQLKISPESVNTLTILCQQPDFLENPELRHDVGQLLYNLTQEEYGKEVLENYLRAYQDSVHELTKFHEICQMANLIYSFHFRGHPLRRSAFNQVEVPKGSNLSDIFTALKKSLASKLYEESRKPEKDEWQKINQLLGPETFKRIVSNIGEKDYECLSKNREIFLDLGITSEEFQELVKKTAHKDPRLFIIYANRKDWQDFLGKETFKDFLGILPSGTKEARNAFTHNKYDRTSALLLLLAHTKGFSLRPNHFEIIKNYIGEFGLAKISKLFEYYRNLSLHESGEIDVLPPDQVADGVNSSEDLKNQFGKIARMTTAEQPYLETSNMTNFELTLLSSFVGHATHRWSRPIKLEGIIDQFSQDLKEGKISPVLEGHEAASVNTDQVEYSVGESSDNKPRKSESFNLFAKEILKTDNPLDTSDLKTRLNKKIEGLEKLYEVLGKQQDKETPKKLTLTNEQLQKLRKISEDINQSQDLDKLMEIFLDVDKATAESLKIFPLIREIVFRLVFEKMPLNKEDILTKLNEGYSHESSQKVIELIDELVKEHALNLTNNNAEAYWTLDTFNKIKQTAKDKTKIDLYKIFDGLLKELKADHEKFKAKQKGTQVVKVIPDRGLIGELSGYIANACYTKEYPLLRDRPNLVPYKFVAEDGVESRLIGSVLTFELTQDNGDKVMLMRAFNVPNESSVNVSGFIEKMLDHLAQVGRKRGIKRIIVPGIEGTISNYPMTDSHIRRQYVEGKQPIILDEGFDFNGKDYELKKDCFIAREII